MQTVAAPEPPNLDGAIQAAAEESRRLTEAAGILDSQFKAAVTEERFDDAQRVKDQIPAAQHAAALAAAHLKALTDVQQQIHDAENKRAQEAYEAERRAAARAQFDRAMEDEQEALAEVRQLMAEAEAGLAAVRLSLRAAVDREHAVTAARHEQNDARVLLGEIEPVGRVGHANFASAKIAASQVLKAILNGQSQL